jgi:hypothetical protein
MTETRLLLCLALCVLAVALPLGAQAAYQVGDHIGDFTLNDAWGNPVSLYDYEGLVIWLVFWTDT